MIEEVSKIIKDILKNKGNDREIQISESTSLREDLSFDSFDMAELTVKIESEFGVDIFEDGIVYTVGEIVKKLKNE